MENTGSVAYQLLHPNFLVWILEHLTLLGVVSICVRLLYWKATTEEKPKKPKNPGKDMIYNKHTGPEGMPLDEYYRRKKEGEFKD